jgi:protein TonB
MMLAYAANRPTAGNRQSSPNALLFIISVHVAVAAVVMSMKLDLPKVIRDGGTDIIFIPKPVDPPPNPQPRPRDTHASPLPTPPIALPLPPKPTDWTPDPGSTDAGSTIVGGGSGGAGMGTDVLEPIKLPPIRHDPRLLTSPAELKPPYPASKLAAEEEATLNLRLTIDKSGRVISVEPLGRADPVFVAAARRHLLAHWRYAPATADGLSVAFTLNITLRFQLDG